MPLKKIICQIIDCLGLVKNSQVTIACLGAGEIIVSHGSKLIEVSKIAMIAIVAKLATIAKISANIVIF